MNYELAKQLKDAGFPQKEFMFENKADGDWPMDLRPCDWPYNPTLPELIEACGEEFNNMFHIEKKWRCCSFQDEDVMGNTPEEAVANLWLELNKK